MEEKTYVEDIDRSLYDFRNEDKDAYRIEEGLTKEIVEQISREKHDPEWMREFRLKSLDVYNKRSVYLSLFCHGAFFNNDNYVPFEVYKRKI